MKRMKIPARLVKKGDRILIHVRGCDPQEVGEAITPAEERRGLIYFRMQCNSFESVERRHFPSTMILIERDQ